MDAKLEAIYQKAKARPLTKWPKLEDLDKERTQVLASKFETKINQWLNEADPHDAKDFHFRERDFGDGFFEVDGFPDLMCTEQYIEAACALIEDKFKGEKYKVVLNNVHWEDDAFLMSFYITAVVN